ncbi:MAG: hypothetical protein JSR78_09950 [Proteobacteria bacterium]|nr:hypothetical protein [Pseudomonadota bacterium]
MRTATTSTTIDAIEEPSRALGQSSMVRIAGLAVASLFPAAFWSAVLGFGALWLGKPLSSTTIMVVGASIALFLFAICAPLMLRRPATELETEAEIKIESRKA